MKDQEIINNQCFSDYQEKSLKKLKQLELFLFLDEALLFDIVKKQQYWDDLHTLTNYKDSLVRSTVATAFGSIFSQVPDKQQAWNDLHILTNDEDICVRSRAAESLGSIFSQVPDKQQAWNDLHRLTNDEDIYVRSHAAESLRSVYSYVPDKQQAWNDIIRLINDKDSFVRERAASAFGVILSEMPTKLKEWNDLIKLLDNKDIYVRDNAVEALSSMLSDITNMPDKQKVWSDLFGLIYRKDSLIRKRAISVASSVFSQVRNNQQTWNYLTEPANSEHKYVMLTIFDTLVFEFSHVPDKQQAWNDIIRLINDEDSFVRECAASALSTVILSEIPDKQKVWSDLIEIISDKDYELSKTAVSTLGTVLSDIPDKQKAWDDLIGLTNCNNNFVRVYAYYYLGKASILNASQAEKEEDYKKELEKAVEFFDKASKDSSFWKNPSQFCLPFYRSFQTIIFQRKETKKEVDKYLEEAKNAIKGSKSKELLFEAVNNLANALNEVQNLENLDLESMKGELNFYRIYCDRAAELMRYSEESAPFATSVIRKGLPLLDRNLKGLLEEIQEKARSAYRQSKGTAAEEIAYNVCREVKRWEIGSQDEMTQMIEGLIETFRLKMPHLPGYEHIFKEIEGIRDERDLVKQYTIISRLIGLIPIFDSMPEHVVQDIKDIKEKTTSTSDEVKSLQLSVDSLMKSVDQLQNPREYLDVIQRNLEEIKNDIPEMGGKIDEVLRELYSPLSTNQKLKLAIPIIPSLVSYELETDVPKLVADKIEELKSLLSRFKKK